MTAAAPAASPAPPQVMLAHHLRQVKLPTFLREYEKVAAEAAREGLDHVRFLLRLAELELIDRERRMVERRICAAHFPAVKSFDTFDFTAIPSLNKPLVIALGNSDTPRQCYCSRQQRHRQDACGPSARPRRLSARLPGLRLHGGRPRSSVKVVNTCRARGRLSAAPFLPSTFCRRPRRQTPLSTCLSRVPISPQRASPIARTAPCLTFRANLRHKAYAAPILVSWASQAATMLAVSRQFGSKRTL